VVNTECGRLESFKDEVVLDLGREKMPQGLERVKDMMRDVGE
jgi:hypothetical protein